MAVTWLDRAWYGNFRPKGGNDISDRRVATEVDHHTPGQEPKTIGEVNEEMRQILSGHINQGWSDIGYTWVVWDQYAIEGRGYGRTGAHAPGANSSSIGIAFLLDGRNRQPTKAEWATARTVMQRGVDLGYVSQNYDVTGHRDWVATTCPGDLVYAHIHDPRDSDILVPPPGHEPREDEPVQINSNYRGVMNNEEGVPKHTYDIYDMPADGSEGGDEGVQSYILVQSPAPQDIEILWNSGTVRNTGIRVSGAGRFKVASRGQGGSDYTTVRSPNPVYVEGRINYR